MTLASQMTRSGPGMRVSGGGGGGGRGRGGMSRGTRRRLRAAGVLLGLLLAAGGVAYWQLSTGESEESAGDAPGGASSDRARRAGAGDAGGSRLAADPLGGGGGAPGPRNTASPSAGPSQTGSTTLSSATPAPPVVLDMGASAPAKDPVAPADGRPLVQPQTVPANSSTTTTPAPSAAGETAAPAAPPPANPPTALPREAGATGAAVQALIAAADAAEQKGNLVEARAKLNRALVEPGATERDRAALRERLTRMNDTLIFSPTIAAGDTLSEMYAVASGDSLVKIARKLGLAAESSFIARVNKMSNPNRLSVGQKLKVVRGPFQAVVDKSDFRMDVYVGGPSSPGSTEAIGSDWIYVRSFRVGLGEKGGTPLGLFAVKDNSKLINPHWVNPRTGEKFNADDPKNPIGERWIGLIGIDEATRTAEGYGVHGTIDAPSIGQEMSMGCVRLDAADVELVYELLMPRVSTVRIVP